MKVEKKSIGTIENHEVIEYKLVNDNGLCASFLNMGGTATELLVKDKDGNFRDVILQYKDLPAVYECKGSFDVIVARNANRIANATANISGVEYKLNDNNGGNNLHSGLDYFHKKFLDAKTYESESFVSVEFSYKFKDMEQGFPGNLDFKITYTITNENEFKIRYEGISDKDTIFNPTWHGYFNLKGHDKGDISTHNLKINAEKFTAVNDKCIPIELTNVEGTALDFRKFKKVTDGIDAREKQIEICGGFDHNYAIDDYDGSLKLACEVKEEESGISMEVYTDMPGVQFYTGNGIHYDNVGKHGDKYVKRGGFCLETQYFPNAINDDRFVSPLIKKGEKKVLNTVYKFKRA